MKPRYISVQVMVRWLNPKRVSPMDYGGKILGFAVKFRVMPQRSFERAVPMSSVPRAQT